jgi:hypothetical protein
MPLIFEEKGHKYFLDGREFPSVTTVLSDMGLIDTSWFTPEACQRGTYVHEIIEWDQSGELDYDTVDNALIGYLDAWKQFVADTGYASLCSEYRMVSEMYRFAGTADQVGSLNNCRCIIDVKSGAVSPCTSLQLSGYEILYDAPCKRFALQLKEDGKYSLKEYTDRNDRAVFLSAVALWWWRFNNLRKG